MRIILSGKASITQIYSTSLFQLTNLILDLSISAIAYTRDDTLLRRFKKRGQLINHIFRIFIFDKLLCHKLQARGNLSSSFIQAKNFFPIRARESELDAESCRRMTHFSDEEIYSLQRFTRIDMYSIMWKYPNMILKKWSTLKWLIELSHKIRISRMSELDDHKLSSRPNLTRAKWRDLIGEDYFVVSGGLFLLATTFWVVFLGEEHIRYLEILPHTRVSYSYIFSRISLFIFPYVLWFFERYLK